MSSLAWFKSLDRKNKNWIKRKGIEGEVFGYCDHRAEGADADLAHRGEANRRAIKGGGLWDRFPTARTVQQMMDTMERIIDDPYAYRGSPFPSLSGDEGVVGGGYRRGRTLWEIKEGEGAYKMRFDIPGMTKKDVKLCVEDRVLVVKAEKAVSSLEEEAEAKEWSAKSYGRYNSKIALPDNVEVEKIKAEVKDGVLYITIPKVSSTSKVLDIDVQ